MKIKITKFAARQFDRKFGATKILDYTPEQFENIIQNSITFKEIESLSGIEYNGSKFRVINIPKSNDKNDVCKELVAEANNLIDGYAPFCKLLPIKNFTDARVGSLPITIENYQYIRSGYSARTENELPILSRWLELPLGRPKAEWLMIVLYSKEQIEKEAKEQDTQEEIKFDADWGIVSILGQDVSIEVPLIPVTIMRNALGMEYGGSGFPIDKKRYAESVDYWEHHAIVK